MVQTRAFKAGLVYVGLVFAIGFVLGTLRVLTLVPAVGELAATAIELPVILAASWFACKLVVSRLGLPAEAGDRLVMGGTAFGTLLLLEAGVSMVLMERSLAAHLAAYFQAPKLLGLLGQVAFGLFPVLQIRPASRASG